MKSPGLTPTEKNILVFFVLFFGMFDSLLEFLSFSGTRASLKKSHDTFLCYVLFELTA